MQILAKCIVNSSSYFVKVANFLRHLPGVFFVIYLALFFNVCLFCIMQFSFLAHLFFSFQVMLDNPVLENPVNLEAASMCRKRPLQYKQMALDCVFASRQIEGR